MDCRNAGSERIRWSFLRKSRPLSYQSAAPLNLQWSFITSQRPFTSIGMPLSSASSSSSERLSTSDGFTMSVAWRMIARFSSSLTLPVTMISERSISLLSESAGPTSTRRISPPYCCL